MKNGIAASGAGGAIGFLAGALSVESSKRKYDVGVGTSSGAILIILFAVGKLNRLISILKKVVDSDIIEKRTFKYFRRFLFHKIGLSKPINGIYDNTPLRKLLRKELLNTKTNLDVYFIAANLKTGEQVNWHVPKNTVIDESNVDTIVSQVISSTAIPGVFPPEEIDGKLYIDGGVVTHTPIKPLRFLLPEAEHITIISTYNEKNKHVIDDIKSDIDFLPSIITRLISLVPALDFMEFDLKNKLGAYKINGYKYFPNTIITPDEKLSPTVRFHHTLMKKDIAHGIKKATFNSLGDHIYIERFRENNYQTKGILQVIKKDFVVFECKTLELPWEYNKKNISRIPSGVYKFVKHNSPKFGDVLWIQDVPDRSEILIHYGNYKKDTEGCILVGESFFDIDGDGHLDTTNSISTLKKLYNVVDDVNKIIIVDNY